MDPSPYVVTKGGGLEEASKSLNQTTWLNNQRKEKYSPIDSTIIQGSCL